MSWRNNIGSKVKELRFVFCQSSSHSAGARSYVQHHYQDIKSLNPSLPFLVRECNAAQPTVMARYDFGVEKRIYLNNLSEQEVDTVVQDLVEQADKINS